VALLIFLPAIVNRESASAKDGVSEKEEWQRRTKAGRENEREKEKEKEREILREFPFA